MEQNIDLTRYWMSVAHAKDGHVDRTLSVQLRTLSTDALEQLKAQLKPFEETGITLPETSCEAAPSTGDHYCFGISVDGFEYKKLEGDFDNPRDAFHAFATIHTLLEKAHDQKFLGYITPRDEQPWASHENKAGGKDHGNDYR